MLFTSSVEAASTTLRGILDWEILGCFVQLQAWSEIKWSLTANTKEQEVLYFVTCDMSMSPFLSLCSLKEQNWAASMSLLDWFFWPRQRQREPGSWPLFLYPFLCDKALAVFTINFKRASWVGKPLCIRRSVSYRISLTSVIMLSLWLKILAPSELCDRIQN